MDKRSWLWKKKSSDKQAAEKSASASDSSKAALLTVATQIEKISDESYKHITELENLVKFREDEVKTLENELQELNEKLSEAHIEMTNKENLVKQQAKVAEDAVSGWEKAEEEAVSLKNHLESVTLLRLTAEDRASHLDGALKECMRQIRNLKEEHDKRLQEVVLNKIKQSDKMKFDLEAKIANLGQELLASAAENAALSRSLQERSNMLINLNEEKSKAEVEIQLLKVNIESCEKEVHSLKYEVNIARKEVEIRSEEKNMSLRTAEAANKQHLEGVKKIAKLEAECQRLRGLVRKKLPGPGAVAQMKLEVGNLGRDYGEIHSMRSSVKPRSLNFTQLPEFSFDNMMMYQKENELLTERLLAMEEETKMLKEALSKRTSELKSSRSLCAAATSKLQSLDTRQLSYGELGISPRSNSEIPAESFYGGKVSNPPSFTSRSDEDNDDNISCACSLTPTTISPYFKNVKNDSPHKSECANNLSLMDDFLEIEKLSCLSSGPNMISSISNESDNCRNPQSEKQLGQIISKNDIASAKSKMPEDPLLFAKLQSQISKILDSIAEEKDLLKVLEDIRHAMEDVHGILDQKPTSSIVPVAHCLEAISDAPNSAKIAQGWVSMSGDGSSHLKDVMTADEQLEFALSQIFNFVIILGDEDKNGPGTSPDEDGLHQKVKRFSTKYAEPKNRDRNLIDFVIDIAHLLSKVRDLNCNSLGVKSTEVETGTYDCIDKIALPENKPVVESSRERYLNGISNFSDSTSDPDIPHDGNLVPISESTATSWKCSLEEFEQLKLDKNNLVADLTKCIENFERTNSQLLETEVELSEVKSQLAFAQKSNSLAETRLKCMAESYKTLETRAEEIQAQFYLFKGKTELLDNELQVERKSLEDAMTKCKNLQEKLQRFENFASTDNNCKTSQDLAAAADKLAECQETMFILSKQLKAFRPQTDSSSQNSGEIQKVEVPVNEELVIGGTFLHNNYPSDSEAASSETVKRAGSESPLSLFDSHLSLSSLDADNPSKSPINSIYSKHSPSKSGSSPIATPEKHPRGFSRFFSSKPRNDV